ncbi:MAG: Si-specific NAD(P)(+) transhydrogenase [Chloroflexi bacterium]|nr:Si-specific NAD(P)(+) transhydrogenase [Chloroflexota bacterium]
MAYDYDLLVIGSGPAGEKGAAQAAYFGKRVAIIEKAEEPGGAAVHTGTLPSKTLRETALFLSGYRQRELYSISVSLDPGLAVPRLLSRKDAVREMEVARIHENLDRHRIEMLHGTARVVDGHTVEVAGPGGSRSVTGEFILIATGSVPFHPAGIDFPDTSIDDSDEILTIDSMPRTLVVLGAGVIGCEYACVFAAMGVGVTLLDSRPNLLPFLDTEISRELQASMVRLGIDVRLGEVAASVLREGDGIAVRLASGASLHCDRLLNAAGRNGATAGLGLEEAGVRMAPRGCVDVDGEYRTNVPSIFAAGDVVGFPALASTSMEQGRVAVCRAFGFEYKQQMSALLPYGIFTIPEVSAVGLTEQEAAAKGQAVVCGRALYRDNARGKIIGASEGMVKLVFDAGTRRLAGTHIIGDGAAELLHIGQAMIALGGTVETLIETVFNYPTLSECYKYAAYDALGRWPA